MFAIELGSAPKPTKNVKTKKKRKSRQNRCFVDKPAPLSSEIAEWLQEFRENLVGERVPEHRDSHASSFHEVSLEDTSKK